MTVSQLLANTTSRELTEWRVFFPLDQELQEEAENKKKVSTMRSNLENSFLAYQEKYENGDIR